MDKVIRADIESVISSIGPAFEELSGKTLLVTGADGFIPSYFVDTILVLNETMLKKNPAKRNEGVGLSSPTEVAAANQQRIASDRLRYKKYYGVDYLRPKNYDLVLDTTSLTPEQAFAALWQFVSSHQTAPPKTV